MQSTHTELLPFTQLPLAARRAHVFPALQHKALLSKGQLCNSNFTAVFHNGQVQLSNDDRRGLVEIYVIDSSAGVSLSSDGGVVVA